MRAADVDLNLLVVLDALITERNVTRAARRLGSTQPSCSRALGRLRRIFGDQLLVRVGHDMQPTPMAEMLAPQVRELVALADQTLNTSLEFDPSEGERSFVISCSDYLTFLLMSPVVRRLRSEAPRVQIHLLPYQVEVFALLRRGDVDFVIEPASFRDLDGLHSVELFRDRWQLAMWSDSELARGEVDVEQLVNAPYLTYTLGIEQIPNLADRALHQQGVRPKAMVSTGNFSLVPALLRGTDMVSLMAERGARALAAQHELTLRDPPISIPEIVQTLHWSPRNQQDPAHRWMSEILVNTAAEL